MAARFWVGGTGTWDASDTTHWAASSNGAGGASVPGSSDTVTFDGSSGGGTVTVSHASLSISSLTTTAFTGTLDFATNDNDITIGSSWTDTGSGTHTVNMGDGTWTLQGTNGAVFTVSGANLTLNANGSTILFSATATTARVFGGGGKTFNNFTVTNASADAKQISISGSNTFNNLTFTNCLYVAPLAGTTQTISGTLTYDGQSKTNPGVLTTNTGAAATLSVANATTLNYLTIACITKSGAGSITANNSYDGGGNTSVTINAPASGGALNNFIG